MEIATIYYKAKDGRIFTDPLECEEYESRLGVIPCTVASLILDLAKMDPDMYICGTVHIRRKNGTRNTYVRYTMCIDDKLESFVNVDNLRDEQRYIVCKVKDLVLSLKDEERDDPEQHMIIFSKDINMKNVGISANFNPDIWDNKSI